ncbi:MAG: hypothetical protein SH859_15125 [Hyphomicrobium aestuarii]|nr:hypothetical protein [Hyphomicrobium aestuarii]
MKPTSMPASGSTAVVVKPEADSAYLNWSSILAGSVLLAATLMVLTPFGAAIGLSMTSAYTGQGASGTTIGILAIFWFAFVHLYAAGVGGYVAGRLRPVAGDGNADEVAFRDGMNGLVVWAVGIVLSMVVLMLGLMSAAQTAATTSAIAMAPAMANAMPASNSATLSPEYVTDLFLRPVGQATPAPTPRSPEDVRAEIGRIVATGVVSGDLAEGERQYLSTLIARQSGLSQADATARVNETITRMKQTRDEAAARARAAAEAARQTTAMAMFWMTLLSLLTGAAAWYAAQMGGRHRNDGTVFLDRRRLAA